MNNRIRQFVRPDLIASILTVVTLSLVAWQHWGMNRTLTVSPGQGLSGWVTDDSDDRGNSRVHYRQDGNAFGMDCEIGTAISYPYCNLLVPLRTDESGVDLTQYQTLELELFFESSIRDSVRVSLNHFYPDDESNYGHKVNQQVISPRPDRGSYRLNLSDFYVPSWWVHADRTLPPEGAKPNLRNIKHLVLTTGDMSGEREVSLALFRAEFRGKWITADTLYVALIWPWALFMLAYLGCNAHRLYRTVQDKNREAEQLRALNRLLDLRSKQFEDLAKHDSLTGLMNRAGVRDALREAVRDYKRQSTPFALLMIDLDNFKQLNDNFGHDEGDRVLREFSTLLQRRCRASDHPARWGGEEFIVICRHASAEAARVLAEDICQSLRDAALGAGGGVTCSIGVAEIDHRGIDELFKRADAALYRAKRQGRDQVVMEE